MPHARRLRGAVGPAASLLLVLVVLGACTGDEPESSAEPSEPSTPLASYATDDVELERAPFCEDLPDTAIEEALGGPVASSTTYDNGDRARLAEGVRDVAHEYDCTYTAGDRTTARAWIFAPPVPDNRARELAREAGRAKGCRPQPDAPALGEQSIALLCDGDGGVTASYRGLLGDAWLTCSLDVPAGTLDDEALLDRTGRWCVQVAEASSF